MGRALEAWDEDVRVVVLGTGGLSHQLDGQRAGFINKAFDVMCMDAIVDDPERLTRLLDRSTSSARRVRRAPS